MYEIIHFDNHAQTETYGKDSFGEFGTLLATDSDLSIPEPDSQSEPQVPSHRNVSPEDKSNA
jgi:hypothetical protein